LEFGAWHVQGELESPQIPCKISVQLGYRFPQKRVGILPVAMHRFWRSEFDGADSGFACNQSELQIVYKHYLGPLEHGNSLPQTVRGYGPEFAGFLLATMRSR
jgi:hypothetical protein